MKIEYKAAVFYAFTAVVIMWCVIYGSRAVTTFSENRKPLRKNCIVIDPGHGGEDGGAVAQDGTPESAYNLEISRRLRDMLQLLGYETKMTRDSDVSIYTKGETLSQKKISDLKERVKLINETEGAVLLSIHQNYYSDGKYCGAQVFYAKTDGSEQLAKQLQSTFTSALDPANRRQAKKSSGVYLMEKVSCPGVLIECGFLSNPEESEKLKNAEYQKRLSMVIAATTSQYLSYA